MASQQHSAIRAASAKRRGAPLRGASPACTTTRGSGSGAGSRDAGQDSRGDVAGSRSPGHCSRRAASPGFRTVSERGRVAACSRYWWAFCSAERRGPRPQRPSGEVVRAPSMASVSEEGEVGAPPAQRLDRKADPASGVRRVGTADGVLPRERLVQDKGQRVDVRRLTRRACLRTAPGPCRRASRGRRRCGSGCPPRPGSRRRSRSASPPAGVARDAPVPARSGA